MVSCLHSFVFTCYCKVIFFGIGRVSTTEKWKGEYSTVLSWNKEILNHLYQYLNNMSIKVTFWKADFFQWIKAGSDWLEKKWPLKYHFQKINLVIVDNRNIKLVFICRLSKCIVIKLLCTGICLDSFVSHILLENILEINSALLSK